MRPNERAKQAARRSIGATAFARAIGGCGQVEAARKLGVTQAAVSKWSSGDSTPMSEHRASIEKTFDVNPDDWDRYIDTTKPAAVLARVSRGTVREDAPLVRDMAAQLIREMLEDRVSTTSEKTTNLLRITQAMIHVGKITGEISTITEGTIVKLPPFRSLVKKLFAALQPWPDAIEAVTETLAEVEQNDESDP